MNRVKTIEIKSYDDCRSLLDISKLHKELLSATEKAIHNEIIYLQEMKMFYQEALKVALRNQQNASFVEGKNGRSKCFSGKNIQLENMVWKEKESIKEIHISLINEQRTLHELHFEKKWAIKEINFWKRKNSVFRLYPHSTT